MGKKITPSATVQIAMDSRGTSVAGQLPYYNNMLYLPLPDTSECINAEGSISEDKIVIASVQKKEAPFGPVNT